MPSYVKRKTKTKGLVWDVFFRVPDDGDLVQKKLSGYPTKRDAQRAYEDYVRNGHRPSDSSRPQVTVSEAFDKYAETMQNVLAVSTLAVKKRYIEKYVLPDMGERSIESIKSSDIIKWQEKIWNTKSAYGKLYAQSSCEVIREHFVVFMNWASNEYCFPDPFVGVKKPRRRENKKEMHIWSEKEFSEFVTQIDNIKYEMYFTLLFYSGCRKNEINALTVDDFVKTGDIYSIKISKSVSYLAGKGKNITPPKTPAGNRTVSLPSKLTSSLDDFLEGKSGYLWYVTPSVIENAFHRVLEKTDLPRITIHDLRHSHASLLISSGIPATAVSKRLGHASTETTLVTYTHAVDAAEYDVRALIDKMWDTISKDRV